MEPSVAHNLRRWHCKHKTYTMLLVVQLLCLSMLAGRAEPTHVTSKPLNQLRCAGSPDRLSAYAASLDDQTKTTLAEFPLHNATTYWDVAAVRKLLSQGADPNARTPRGTTPLHMVLWTTSIPYWHPYTDQVGAREAQTVACRML